LGDPPDRVLGLRLRQQGLPDTPATRRHLRAVAAGRLYPLPARGALITTQLLTQAREVVHEEKKYHDFFSPTTRVISDAQSIHLPAALLRAIGVAIGRHRDWVQERFTELGDRSVWTDRRARHLGSAE